MLVECNTESWEYGHVFVTGVKGNRVMFTRITFSWIIDRLCISLYMDQEDYEEQCLQNRARFQALLKEMGYDGDLLPPTKKASQTPRATRKRKASVDTEDGSDGNEENHKKIARVGDYESGKEGTGLRRSRRNQGKKVDYTGDSIGRPVPRLTSYGVGMKMKSEPRSVGKRLYDP